MANNSKKYASLTSLQTFLDNLKTTFASIAHSHKISDITDYTVDDALSSTSTNPVQNNVLNTEFDAVSDAMGALEQAIDAKVDTDTLSDYYTKTETDGKFTTTIEAIESARDDAANQDVVVLREAQDYIDTELAAAVETVKTDAINRDVAVLAEAQGYADALRVEVDGKADESHSHTVADITDLTASTTELNYMDGVTSNVQTQLNGKQATITGGASTIASSNLTASRALVSNGSGKVAVSAVTSTELGYLDGVTSSVQTQLNGKVPTSRTINSKALSSNITLSASDVGAYTKTEIDNMEFVTIQDIDTICSATIQMASLSNEVTF